MVNWNTVSVYGAQLTPHIAHTLQIPADQREHSTHSITKWFRAHTALYKLWQAPPSGHT